MGRDLAVFHEATMDNARQAKETPLRLFGKLMSKSRTNCVVNLGTTPVEGIHTTDSVTAALGLVEQYLSMFSCSAGSAYSVFSVNY